MIGGGSIRKIAIFAIVLTLFLIIPSISAGDITIDNSTSIKNGVDIVSDGDTVTLEKGTYKENGIEINKNITLQGKGDADDVIIDGENKNVIIKSDTPVKLTIKDITFKNALYAGNGGAISFYNGGELIIENCKFINNRVTAAQGEAQGGSIYVQGASNNYVNLKVKNSDFINNSADTDGGAINSEYATITLDNCIFDGNHGNRDGGAISNRRMSDVNISSCIFTNNYANEWGGAINNWLSQYSINDCIFINNRALVEGGAIETCGELMKITNSVITRNIALEKGGAINIHKDAKDISVVLNNNDISENDAPKGSQIHIDPRTDGTYDFEDNYWGNLTVNSTDWQKAFETNGMCDNPTKFLEPVKNTILVNEIKRGYNSPYDYSATFLNNLGGALKNVKVSLKINNQKYELTTDSNGVAKLALKLAVGKYSVTAINPITCAELTKTLSIQKRITGNSNLNKDYLSGIFKVRVVGDDGNYVKSGQIVKFKIGKTTYNVKTDKNGYASLKIVQTPGKYTITATYKGETVKNTINVKQILKASNLSKKKSKKIKYSATLKSSNGKAIKNKKITFKVKGKTYYAKTNSKGKATITLKNFKVGKYKITIKYVNDSIKKTIKIKKR